MYKAYKNLSFSLPSILNNRRSPCSSSLYASSTIPSPFSKEHISHRRHRHCNNYHHLHTDTSRTRDLLHHLLRNQSSISSSSRPLPQTSSLQSSFLAFGNLVLQRSDFLSSGFELFFDGLRDLLTKIGNLSSRDDGRGGV